MVSEGKQDVSAIIPLILKYCIIDVIAKVETYVKAHKKQIEEGRWVEGAGWDQNIWPVKSFPQAVGPRKHTTKLLLSPTYCHFRLDRF